MADISIKIDETKINGEFFTVVATITIDNKIKVVETTFRKASKADVERWLKDQTDLFADQVDAMDTAEKTVQEILGGEKEYTIAVRDAGRIILTKSEAEKPWTPKPPEPYQPPTEEGPVEEVIP